MVFYKKIFYFPTIDPPDLFVRPSNWRTFREFFVLPVSSVTLVSKNYFFLFALRSFTFYNAFLYVSIYLFVYMKLRCFAFSEKIVLNYKLFWNLTIKSFLGISFYSFIFNRHNFVNDFHWLSIKFEYAFKIPWCVPLSEKPSRIWSNKEELLQFIRIGLKLFLIKHWTKFEVVFNIIWIWLA